MSTKSNLKRLREALDLKDDDELGKDISEDEESNSDPDFFSESESDDTSTDEHISENENSSDAGTSDDDVHINTQLDTIEKKWCCMVNKKT